MKGEEEFDMWSKTIPSQIPQQDGGTCKGRESSSKSKEKVSPERTWGTRSSKTKRGGGVGTVVMSRRVKKGKNEGPKES